VQKLHPLQTDGGLQKWFREVLNELSISEAA